VVSDVIEDDSGQPRVCGVGICCCCAPASGGTSGGVFCKWLLWIQKDDG